MVWIEPGGKGLNVNRHPNLTLSHEWIQRVSAPIGNALDGVVSLCNDIAQWSVRPDAVYEEFRNAGHGIDKPSDIASLSLEDIVMVVGCLAAKYIRRRFTGYSPCPQFVSYLYRT